MDVKCPLLCLDLRTVLSEFIDLLSYLKKNKITGYLGIKEALQIIRFLLLTSFHQPENSLCSQSVHKLHSSVSHLWKNHWGQHTHV